MPAIRITLAKDAVAGELEIPRGEYLVMLDPQNGKMLLTGSSGTGGTFSIPAVRRRRLPHVKLASLRFYCSGGENWMICAVTPDKWEWVSSLVYQEVKT